MTKLCFASYRIAIKLCHCSYFNAATNRLSRLFEPVQIRSILLMLRLEALVKLQIIFTSLISYLFFVDLH